MAKDLISVLAILAIVGSSTAGQGQPAPSYRPDVVLVKLRAEAATKATAAARATATGVASLDRLNADLGVRSMKRTVARAVPAPVGRDHYGLSCYFTIELPEGSDVEAAIKDYLADPNVEAAEPDYIMPMTAVPNDPSYSQQWTHWQSNDVDIDAQEAWDLETGDSTVLVGIIDSGILYDHEDLIRSMWVNPGEDLDGDGVVFDPDDLNGIDDDLNGYVDDLIGYDFMQAQGGCWPGEDCNGPDNDPDDFTGHGTHVGGIVAATTSNGLGVAGVAGGWISSRKPGVKLMGLRAGYLASDGLGYVVMSACAEAMDYAVANGASAFNCSWGSSPGVVVTAAQNAIANGLVVCEAAGNDNSTAPNALSGVAGVISVAAIGKSGVKASFSSYGTWVDISAPGVDILNTYGASGLPSYASLQGTSMASPTVCGVAALLKSHHLWFTNDEIDTLILNHTDDVYAANPGYIGELGTGRLNAYNGLAVLTTASFDVDTAFGKTPLTVQFTDISPNAPSGPYHYTFGDGGEAFTQNASHQYTLPGIYGVTFTASGPSGPHTRTCPELIVAVEDTIEYADIMLAIGQKAPVPVRVRNTHPMTEITLPFRLTGTPTIFLDSLTRTPATAGWTVTLVFDNRFSGQIAWKMTAPAGMSLPAGSDSVANLWVRTNLFGTPGDVETVDSATYSTNTLRLKSSWASFKPDFVGGSITLFNPCDCPFQADLDASGAVDAVDLAIVIDIVFFGASDVQDASCPRTRADFNDDGFADAVDLAELIDHVFFGGPGPADPCAP